LIQSKVLGRNSAVLEDQLPLKARVTHAVVGPAHRESRRFVVHQKAGYSALRSQFFVGHGEGHREVGLDGVGNDALGAVEHEALVLLGGFRLKAGGIGAGIRLGQGKAGSDLPPHQRVEVPFPLLLCAGQQDGRRSAVPSQHVVEEQGVVEVRLYLQNTASGEGEPSSPDLLRHIDAVQAQFLGA
jgi:hypothetical protein